MKIRVLLLTVGLALIAAGGPVASQGWTPTGSSPLALRSHPRLLVTAASLPAVRARMASGGFHNAAAKTWASWLDANYSRAWGPFELPGAIMNYSFAYVLLKDGALPGVSFGHSASEYGNLARTVLFRLVSDNGGRIGDENQEPGIIAYDWLYPLLSTQDRLTLVDWMKYADAKNDEGTPFTVYAASIRGYRVMSGLAVYGDGIDDQWATTKIGQYGAYYRDPTGVTRSESDLGGNDGSAAEGISYGFSYTMRRTLLPEEAYRTANGISVANHYSGQDTRFFRYQPQHLLYRILPWATPYASLPGGRQYVLEKGHYNKAWGGAAEHEYSLWLSVVAGLYQTIDPNVSQLAAWLLQNRTGPLAENDVYILNDWVFGKFIAGPTSTIAPKSPTELGLSPTRYFHEGRFVFRSSWDDLDASYVTMNVNQWHRSPWGRSPLQPGAFQVHRKGPQVINQGGLTGHDWGATGAGPANMLIFPDRTQAASTGDWDDLGGHRRYIYVQNNMRGSIDFVQESVADTLDAMRYTLADAQNDVDYVYADVTRAYNSTRFKDDYNPARVSEVVRQMVYFRPAQPSTDPVRLVIFDRATTTNTKFEKEWLFHTATEPSVNGTATNGQPVRGGHGDRHVTYTGATRVTATNTLAGSNGRTFLTPLLPESRTIVKIGGPNAAGQSWVADSHEYEGPYGDRHPYGSAWGPEIMQYVGMYRIEVIPTTPALSDVFLNVVEVGDANMSAPTPTALLPGVGLAAARVGNRIAVFNKASAAVNTGSFTVDQAGTFKIHIADLTPLGEYDLMVGGSPARHTATAAGTLYLEYPLTAGAQIQLHATGVAGVIPPGPPSNVRLVQ